MSIFFSRMAAILPLMVLSCLGAAVVNTADDTGADYLNRPFIDQNFVPVSNLTIVFNSAAIKFDVCCHGYDYPTTTLKWNNWNDSVLPTVYTRTGQPPVISFSSSAPSGTQYTVFMVDAYDRNTPPYANTDKPFIHWEVVNVDGSDVSTGNTISPYRGPLPGSGTHNYYIMVYQQAGPVSSSTSVSEAYASSSCFPLLKGRCTFDLSRFASEQGLTLVAVGGFRAARDDYTRFYNVQAGRATESQMCAGVPNYTSDCQVVPVVG